MEFGVLGPLEVHAAGGAAIPLTGPKRRALLGLLIVNVGDDIASARLADELWNGAPPKSAATTLQTFVYQLRRRYGVEELLTTTAGYRFDARPEQIDAHRFEQAVDDACRTAVEAPARAARTLRAALDVWRGAAYSDFLSEPWATVEATRLEQLRLEAVEAWAATSIGAEETAGLAAELETWTSRHPLREPLWTLRVVALVADGRPAEALRVGTDLRAVLRDELGVDPSAQFAEVETAVLRGDPLPRWTDLAGFRRRPVEDAPPPESAAPPPQTVAPPRVARRRPPVSAPLDDAARTAPPPDRFVGRAPELEVLESAVEAARNGLPQIVVVVGEPGIGKSRMLDEFTPHAVAHGVQLLYGVCQEDVGVPYLPLASAFAALDAEHDPFRADPPAAAATPGDNDGAQLALYLRATRALLGAAAERVVLLVVEDLHSADDATLGLLRHLVTAGSEDAAPDRAGLVVVLTTHPPDPGTPVDNLIGRLRRSQRTRVIHVRALGAPEVRELAADWFGRRPSTTTAALLVEATGGNPLVLRSTLERLRDQGATLDISASSDLLGSTNLDHELWLRVERAPRACRELLIDAAVLGNGASLGWLAAATELSKSALDDLIDTASQWQLLVADDERYWFDHPQLRQLVYYSTTRDERAARHLRAADRLGALGIEAVVVAHHLTRAGARVDPARMVRVCGDAADDSARLGAWRDAAIYAVAAVDGAAQLALADSELAALDLRAGRATFLARDRDSAIRHLTAAADRARSSGALNVWGRAVVRLAREAVEEREAHTSTAHAFAALDEFITAAGDREPALRAEAHALRSELLSARDDLAGARRHMAIAGDLADQVDDDEVRAKVTFARGVQQMFGVELEAARESFDRAYPIATGLTDPNPGIWCQNRLGLVAFVSGELTDAQGFLAQGMEAARDADNLAECSLAAAISAAAANAQGHFARVEADGERARRAYLAAEYVFTPAILFPTLALARAHRSDAEDAHRALDDWEAIHARRSRRYRPLVDVLLGSPDAAREVLDASPFRFFTGSPEPDLIMSGVLAAQVELGALLELPTLVRGPLETLVELYERGMRFTLGWPAFVPRVVALGLDAIGRNDEAIHWFEVALDDARAVPADTEIARTALDYGRALHGRGDRAGADALLALALERYAAMSIRPAFPGWELLIEPETAAAVPEPISATRVILVTDLAGSTTLNDQLGDRDYVALLREHDDIIRRQLTRCDGVEFKHTGDGIAAWFYSVNRALDCAAALGREFEQAWAGPTRPPLSVKIALSAGEPTVVDGDLLGLSVTVGFRALEYAQPGDVIVTAEVAGLARGLPFSFESCGRRALKGLREPVELFALSTPPSPH